jgi:hypothetical protein
VQPAPVQLAGVVYVLHMGGATGLVQCPVPKSYRQLSATQSIWLLSFALHGS